MRDFIPANTSVIIFLTLNRVSGVCKGIRSLMLCKNSTEHIGQRDNGMVRWNLMNAENIVTHTGIDGRIRGKK